MKPATTRFALVLAALIALTGCASHYVIKLNNGVRLTTASKPKLEGGFYVYKDAQGRKVSVPRGRVTEIAPASMASDDTKFTNPARQR